MQLFLNFLRFYLIYSLVKVVFRFIFTAKSGKSAKKHQEEFDLNNIKKFSEEDKKEVAIDMVFDKICEVYVPQTKAYEIVEDDGIHYFCSWECRQKHIDNQH
ncbi:MAG: hypothetical protein JJT76_15445 [Clostridiaceae bacterium]|nr:hypothetical protein [Clostridiaceae bacterium]